MKTITLALCFSISILRAAPIEDEASKMQRVHIIDREGVVGVFVPSGNLVMIFQKGELAQKEQKGSGGLANPRYFYFESPNGKTILSGWFEPASRFKGVKEDWEANISQWRGKPELEPHSVTPLTEAKWQGVMYHTKHPGGTRVHIKAHWVEAETWIDIHLSEAAANGAEIAEESLKKFLSTLVVKVVDKTK